MRLNRDGSAETEWRYGFQKQRLSIVSPQKGSPVGAASFPIVVNAYDTSHDVASVSWRLGNEETSVGTGSLDRQSATSWSGTSGQLPLPPGTYPFHVEAKDEQGATWTALTSAARRLVETHYDWDVLGSALHETYCRWLGQRV